MSGWKTSGTSVGAVLASLLTLGCCLPLPFLGAAGVAGLSAFLGDARPWLLGLSVILLGAGFLQVYRGMRCRVRQSKTAVVCLAWQPWWWFFSCCFLRQSRACLQTLAVTGEKTTGYRCGVSDRGAASFGLAPLWWIGSSGRSAATRLAHINKL